MKKTLSIFLAAVLMLSFCIFAFAANDNFTPSATGKLAPEIISAKVIGEGDIPDSNIIVTAYKDGKTAEMNVAYDEIMRAEDLSELNSAVPKDYVVRDFFDLTLTGTYADIFARGKKLEVVFKLNAQNAIVLTRCSDATGWKQVESVTENGDGTITVVFASLCPVAVLVPAKQSHPTGVFNTTVLAAFAGVFAVAAAGVFFITKKKASAK